MACKKNAYIYMKNKLDIDKENRRGTVLNGRGKIHVTTLHL